MPVDARSGVFYELQGQSDGIPVMFGLPLMASHAEIFGPAAVTLKSAYLDGLCDRYRVLTMDYPSIGKSADIDPTQLTADRVCADLLRVADAAGFTRFAYVGYSWSGAVGLQLAARTDRLTALIVGGWPPYAAPYANILAATQARIGNVPRSAMVILRNVEQYAQWAAFYASVLHWSEARAVAPVAYPRMVFYGGDGDLIEAGHPVPIASAIRTSTAALEAAGWRVHAYPGRGHTLVLSPAEVLPAVRGFLDEATA